MAGPPDASPSPVPGDANYDSDLDGLLLADEDDSPPVQSAASDQAVTTAAFTPAASRIPVALESSAATPRPSGERPNRYAGACAVCGKRVDAKAGRTWLKVDRWLVRHPECHPPA